MKHSNSIFTKYFTFFVVVSASLLNNIENWKAYVWSSRQLYVVFITMKNIGIQLKVSVWNVHTRRKIPTITSQSWHVKKMERLLVLSQWKSLNQLNIYLTEDHESLRHCHQPRITQSCLFNEALRFIVW